MRNTTVGNKNNTECRFEPTVRRTKRQFFTEIFPEESTDARKDDFLFSPVWNDFQSNLCYQLSMGWLGERMLHITLTLNQRQQFLYDS